MLLFAEVIIISILVISLIMLVIEERGLAKSKVPKGTVREYWNGSERRKSIRVDAAIIVKYNIDKTGKSVINGKTKDISSCGMRLLVNEKLSSGMLLNLEFDLPETKGSILVSGKVVWSHGEFTDRDETGKRIFHAGVEFADIKSADRNRLEGFLERAKN